MRKVICIVLLALVMGPAAGCDCWWLFPMPIVVVAVPEETPVIVPTGAEASQWQLVVDLRQVEPQTATVEVDVLDLDTHNPLVPTQRAIPQEQPFIGLNGLPKNTDVLIKMRAVHPETGADASKQWIYHVL